MASDEEQDGPEDWSVQLEDYKQRDNDKSGPPDDWPFPSWFSFAERDWYWEGKPDPCPVTPLGSLVGYFYLVTAFGEIRRFVAKELFSRAGISDLFGGSPSVRGHTKRPRSSRLANRHILDQPAALAAEHERMPAVRVALQRLLHHERQTVEAATHVCRAARKPHPHLRSQADHRPSARSTRPSGLVDRRIVGRKLTR